MHRKQQHRVNILLNKKVIEKKYMYGQIKREQKIGIISMHMHIKIIFVNDYLVRRVLTFVIVPSQLFPRRTILCTKYTLCLYSNSFASVCTFFYLLK